MKILLLIALSFAFFATPVFPATCGSACTVTGDCPANCPVCFGSCMSCYELGSQADCEDAGTGAAANCGWLGGQCISEMPRGIRNLLFILIPIVALGYQRRRKAFVKSRQA